MKLKQCVVIGYGNVGQAVASLISAREDMELYRVIRRDGVYDGNLQRGSDTLIANIELIDIVFMCMTSIGDGALAYDHIVQFAKEGIPVVICEKAALANFYPELKMLGSSIAYSATVGAAGVIIPAIQKYRSDVLSLHLILNGTLNFLWYRMRRGETFEKALACAQFKGYLETSKETDRESIINTEFLDVFRKTILSFNVLETGSYLRCRDLEVPSLSKKEIDKLIHSATHFRPYVEIGLHKTRCMSQFLRTYYSKGWYIHIGFVSVLEIDGSLAHLKDTFNGVGIFTKVGQRIIEIGKGAHVNVTAHTMIRDAERLLSLPRSS